MSSTAPGGASWTPLHGFDPQGLSDARVQAHYAVQWLARAARAFAPPQPDDGHTSLGWDDALGGFTTHSLTNGARLSFGMKDFSLALHAGEGTARTLLLEGRTDAQVRHWLGEQVDAAGLDALKLDASSPYEMPAHAITQGAPYDAKGAADSLAELAAWFGNAALSLGIIQRQMIERGLDASPVRCWPHHFDIATLTSLPTRSAGVTGYVGAGLSPGDEYYDEPYFYVSVYPRPDPALLPSLPALGHWHQQDFMAAVATARKIVACKHQGAETDDFLRAAVDAAITVLKLPHPSHVQ